MDESRAEAIAQAILQPDLKAQEELRRKRAKEAFWLAERRKVAWLVLVGFAVGAAAAVYSGQRFTTGGVWGALGGSAAGWLWIGWRHWRRAG